MLPTIHRAELASVSGGRLKHVDDVSTLQPIIQQLGEAIKAAMSMKTQNDGQMMQMMMKLFEQMRDDRKGKSSPPPSSKKK